MQSSILSIAWEMSTFRVEASVARDSLRWSFIAIPGLYWDFISRLRQFSRSSCITRSIFSLGSFSTGSVTICIFMPDSARVTCLSRHPFCRHVTDDPRTYECALTGTRLAILAGLLSLFAWFTTFGLFAIFLRTQCCENAATRYLSEASFWVYLIHLPFVALTQIAIAQLSVPTMGKFLLAGATALALSLMTYHVFVRDRWMDVFLNGRSDRLQID